MRPVVLFIAALLLAAEVSAAPVANACAATGILSQVSCTTGLVTPATTLGYAKSGRSWNVVSDAGIGVGYQARQEYKNLLVSELLFTGLADKVGPGFQVAPGITIGYQWNGTSCSVGVAMDAFLVSGGQSSGFLTPFSSLGNLHWILALGVPIG